MPKIGEDMLGDMASLGLEELRAANAGAMAMDAPPMQPTESPAAEQAAPSYADMLNQQAAMSEGRGDAPDQSMSR